MATPYDDLTPQDENIKQALFIYTTDARPILSIHRLKTTLIEA